MTSKTMNSFSPEVREPAVRLVLDQEAEHPSRWQATVSITAKIGCSAYSLKEGLKKAEILKALERVNRELRQASEILCKASAYFAMAYRQMQIYSPVG